MNTVPNITYTYKVGGHLPPDAPSYVVRKADLELYEGLKSGEFCYVLNSRQMGKTSLRVRTMHKLQAEGIACAAIDLTRIGSQDITADQWYAGVMKALEKSFRLPINLRSWLRDRDILTPVQRLSEFIEHELLENVPQNIVIFIDEIDNILSLSFRNNDFFALIRACAGLDRLTFALLGVSTPSDLIQDKKCTPFNIGRAIELDGFKLEEAQPLAKGLAQKANNPQSVLEAILDWTGGQPFLTQKLCNLIFNAESSVPDGKEAEWVENLVKTKIIENWETQDEPPHLKTIRDRLLRTGKATAPLLKLYQEILQHQEIQVEESAEAIELRLSGLVVRRGGKFSIYNRIYESVFNWSWVNKTLTSLQPSFQQLVNEQEQKILSLLKARETKDFDDILYDILGSVTLKLGELLRVDLITIFFIDPDKNELWSISAGMTGGRATKIQIPANNQIAGRVTIYKQAVNLPLNSDRNLSSVVAEAKTQKTGYHIYNELTCHLLNEQGEISAFIQLINKLSSRHNPTAPFPERIDPEGFTEADKQQFAEYAPGVQRILEGCQSCYKFTQRLQASEALTEATRSVSHSSFDSEEIIGRVMAAAKRLMNADRSTLWLLDREKDQLWTKIPFEDGSVRELSLKVGQGFAGRVAETGKPINVPFDLYDYPDSETAKETDKKSGYRTCSLLCMPVWSPDGELLGVTQLINKKRPGQYPEYNPEDWPEAPECFQDTFDPNSQKYMQIFNSQVGVALENARQFTALKQQAENQPQNVVSQTLAMLNQVMDGQGFDDILDATLRSITLKLGKSLIADRTTIFLLDEERNEFWSIIAESEGERSLELRIPADQGIVGEVAASKELINIPFDFYDDPRSDTAKKQDQRNGYRTYTMLAVPLVNEEGGLVAVVQSINKLKRFYDRRLSLSEKIDKEGFTKADEDKFAENATLIRMILESFKSYHKTARGQRVAAALMAATRSVSQSSLELEEILKRVMDAAKELMNADRSTLWLLDRENNQLWTKIPFGNGLMEEIRVEVGQGYAGKVAEMGIPLNIPFDLYDYPDSEIAQKTDRKTGYRTCSLLCMPISNPDGELIGVTQLINKKKSGDYPDYNPLKINQVPDYLQVSFDESDQKYMQIFNNQVGVILQNWELLAAVKRQEETLRDNLNGK
ncbi:MAG TPA: GAF domain-containing protein [Cyanobacteria bacterium UBA11149]|nr:GAF domain-containing protein [Cyanobacteria bacterium UBA11367]HBE61104.1 GAF domain-containing protein [Cyanobacteria bacterium UBA11366]HBK64386.1 GAF domain-containing protein [Cyanobacteria bacterium UBA11166]HBR72720.1 GAF domain-containing protein [Cyanobacteria bacterium UBA11159]HBS70710.1 GAF domain-containing protein [Cyanobacteria bacterium UBA11153]HBW90659.1 GAF domain-containing protein [Cyanobacteria bacterium UBA11149]HCA96125.1 GAF domain-containing protein [Cyanobacteria